jgi:hypothetical protein
MSPSAGDGYTVTTSRTVATAKVSGHEFEYRQNLNFLPKWDRGPLPSHDQR